MAGAPTILRIVPVKSHGNPFAIDPQGKQLCPGSDDGSLHAGARIRIYHESDATAATGAADFSGKCALAARGGDHFVDPGSRNRPKIPAAEIPFFAHQAANLVPIVSLECITYFLRDDRNFLQILRDAPVAVDVPLEHFPVVNAMLPGFSRVAQHQTALEIVEIATEHFSALATWREAGG
jgi:hypothetical protein